MMRFIERVYIVMAIVPLVWLGLVIAQTEGSLVSGIAIGSVIPLLAFVSFVLVVAGLALLYLARRQRRSIWPSLIGTALSSPLFLLVALTWLFG